MQNIELIKNKISELTFKYSLDINQIPKRVSKSLGLTVGEIESVLEMSNIYNTSFTIGGKTYETKKSHSYTWLIEKILKEIK